MKKIFISLLFIILIFNFPSYGNEKEILNKINVDKGVVMLKTPLKDWQDILNQINKDDVNPEINEKLKLEVWPHITLLYGLNEDAESLVTEFLNNLKEPLKYNVTGISLFEARNFDIVKFGIESDQLTEINKKLKTFPYTSSYGGFVPHMTIAFVKKGEGKKYTREFTVPLEFYADEIVYKLSNGKIIEVKIKHDKKLNTETSVRNTPLSKLMNKSELKNTTDK